MASIPCWRRWVFDQDAFVWLEYQKSQIDAFTFFFENFDFHQAFNHAQSPTERNVAVVFFFFFGIFISFWYSRLETGKGSFASWSQLEVSPAPEILHETFPLIG